MCCCLNKITQSAHYLATGRFGCSNRFVFVNLDACMASQAVTLGVIERLKVTALLLHTALIAAPEIWISWSPQPQLPWLPQHMQARNASCRWSLATCTPSTTWLSVASTHILARGVTCNMYCMILLPWALSSKAGRLLSAALWR